VVGRRTSWHRRTRQRWPAAPTVPGAGTPTGQAWARELLTRDDWVVLDTETTGLDAGAEVIDLAVLDRNGTVLLETLLRPLRPIPAGVTRIHGLSDTQVQDAPTFPDIWPTLQALLAGRTIVAYNVAFDARLLRQTAARHGLALTWRAEACAMRHYAAYQRARPCSLESACLRHGIPAGGHRAVADCRATLALLDVIASDE
jgi:DNA polymerase III subunit epsilon